MPRSEEEFDDPEPFEDSGEDWKEETKGKKGANARKSSRLSTKQRKTWTAEHGTDSEEEEEDYRPKKKKMKNGDSKKAAAKVETAKEDSEDLDEEEEEGEEEGSEVEGSEDNSSSGGGKKSGVPTPKEYMAGQYVLKKKDVKQKDKKEKPNIWKIDGKQLLQRFDPFTHENEVRHKNTQVYSGWSINDKEQYIPLKVTVINRELNNTTVTVHWDEIPEVKIDSDSE